MVGVIITVWDRCFHAKIKTLALSCESVSSREFNEKIAVSRYELSKIFSGAMTSLNSSFTEVSKVANL